MSGEDPSFHGLGSRLLVETQLVGEHAVREAGVSTGVEELMCGSSQAVFLVLQRRHLLSSRWNCGVWSSGIGSGVQLGESDGGAHRHGGEAMHGNTKVGCDCWGLAARLSAIS